MRPSAIAAVGNMRRQVGGKTEYRIRYFRLDCEVGRLSPWLLNGGTLAGRSRQRTTRKRDSRRSRHRRADRALRDHRARRHRRDGRRLRRVRSRARSQGRPQADQAGAGRRKDTARARLLREAKAIARLAAPERRRRARRRRVRGPGVPGDGVRRRRDDQELARRTSRDRGARSSTSSSRPGAGSRPRTRPGSSTATSSPTTCCSTRRARPRVVDFGIARQAGGGDDELGGETGDVADDGSGDAARLERQARRSRR